MQLSFFYPHEAVSRIALYCDILDTRFDGLTRGEAAWQRSVGFWRHDLLSLGERALATSIGSEALVLYFSQLNSEETL